MPRLFIAAELPLDARERISEICFGLPGAVWASEEQMHLTLRFIGEVEDSVFHGLREGLAGIQARAFHLSLKGVGHFPLRGAPEILWAGVVENELLSRLRRKIESVLTRYGVEPDTRKFFPHVTMAKVKSAQATWVGRYIAAHSLFALHQIPVTSFNLYSSRLTSEGAVHSLEQTYPLEGILEVE